MRRARGSAYPSGVALEDFSKTVGRFACRGFRPPSLATDWEWGGFKTHHTNKEAVSMVCNTERALLQKPLGPMAPSPINL